MFYFTLFAFFFYFSFYVWSTSPAEYDDVMCLFIRWYNEQKWNVKLKIATIIEIECEKKQQIQQLFQSNLLEW